MMNAHIKNILKIATNPHHMAHPLSHEKPKEISTRERILGVALFALSFLTIAILPTFFVIKAYKKYTGDFNTPVSQKAHALAAAQLNKENVQDLKKNAALNQIDAQGFTELHLAVGEGDLEKVKRFIAAGANPNTLQVEKASPLHTAIMEGNLEVVKALINYDKTDLKLRYEPCSNATPFMLAVYKRQPQVVAEFLKTKKDAIDFNDKNHSDGNIFHVLGISSTNNDLYDLLLNACPPDQRAVLLAARDYQNKTPYERALEKLRTDHEEAPIPDQKLKTIARLKA